MNTEDQYALVERSYTDPYDYLRWNTVAIFPNFDRAFKWCNANMNTSVILLERPRVIGWTKIMDNPVISNFVDQKGVCHSASWKERTSWVKVEPLAGEPSIRCTDILRIRMCQWGKVPPPETEFRHGSE